MHLQSIILQLAFAAFIGCLLNYAARPDTEPAEGRVLLSAGYGLAAGSVVTNVCALFARRLDAEIAPGTEIVSCAPFGVGAWAIVMRMHVFATGGWGMPERAYVRGLPSRTTGALWEGAARVVGMAKGEELRSQR